MTCMGILLEFDQVEDAEILLKRFTLMFNLTGASFQSMKCETGTMPFVKAFTVMRMIMERIWRTIQLTFIPPHLTLPSRNVNQNWGFQLPWPNL